VVPAQGGAATPLARARVSRPRPRLGLGRWSAGCLLKKPRAWPTENPPLSPRDSQDYLFEEITGLCFQKYGTYFRLYSMASDYLLKLRFERYGPDIVDYIRGPLFKSNKAGSATKEASPSATVRDFINRVGWKQRVPPMLALGMEPSRFSKCCFLVTPSRARRVRFGPPDRLSPLGEVYLQPTLTTGHWTGEGGSRERGGEKMVWEPDRFNARVAHRLRGRPRFELIKARDLESLATA